jgi:hypothetical protein
MLDLISIFEGQSGTQLEFGNRSKQCLMITFKGVRICPTTLIIKTQRATQHSRVPNAYVLEGRDTYKNKWVVLVECQSCYGGTPMVGTMQDCIYTAMEVAKLRLRSTETALPSWAHWSISALEIYGRVRQITHWIPQTSADIQKDDGFDHWATDDIQ